MKKKSFILLSSMVMVLPGLTAIACANNESFNTENIPVTRQKRQMNPNVPNITVGDFRLQILDEATVRFEYKYQNPIFGTNDWLDDDTLFVPNRTLYKGIKDYHVDRGSDVTTVTFADIKIVIPNNINADLKGIKVYYVDQTEPIYNSDNAATDNKGDLPFPENTPDVFELVDTPRIIEPPFGYSMANLWIEPYLSHRKDFEKTCGFEIQNHRDIYLTFPRKNAKALRQQYRNLAGPSELVRLSTLGAWDSRYYPYNETTAQEEVDHYYENNLPLDNLVIDTDWRAGFDGKGYFVNETLFPNMPRFLKSMKDQNIEVCFNDHPEPQKNELTGQELDVLNKQEVEFRRSNLAKILDMGLDTWWYDRNWSTSLICPGGNTDEHEAQLNHEVWGDYLYNNVTRQTYMARASEKYDDYGKYVYKRPIAMSNVVQVRNGVWEGFTDTAAHRYSIQWTGDQNSKMLNTEVENVIKTGINSMPYMSSDLAGHTNPIASDYYYQRWMEYGALSPIFRIHCTRDLPRHCQPWLWSEQALETFRNWINLRYRLLPLYYSLARESYENGMPICRALTFNYDNVPDEAKLSEYLIGNNILFAPCLLNDQAIYELEGDWVKPTEWDNNVKASFFEGEDPIGERTSDKIKYYDNINIDDMAAEGQKVIGCKEHFAVRFEGDFVPKNIPGDGEAEVVFTIDDGVSVTITHDGDDPKTFSDWHAGATRDDRTGITVKNGEKYHFVVDYLQNTGGGNIKLNRCYNQSIQNENKKVWLPKGKWLDAFNGNVIDSQGEWTNDIEYPVNENAVFIRLGSMTPLIANARNTKVMDWTKLAYDVYPTKDSANDQGTLYEDDFETVAYQNGYYHKSNYNCYYDTNTQEFVVKLDSSEGWFIGDDVIADRKYTIRLHKTDGLNFGDVTLDGQKITSPDVEMIEKDESVAMPLNFLGASKTEDVWVVTIDGTIRKGHELRIKLA